MEAWREELYRSVLYHSGRKGQKWGVLNGPPYPLDSDQLSASEKRQGGISDSAKEKYGTQKKSSSEMSNSELQSAINRLSVENQYKKMLAEKAIKKPTDPTILKEAVTGARNTAKLIAGINSLKGNSDAAKTFYGLAGAAESGAKVISSLKTIADKNYERRVNDYMRKVNLSDLSDSGLNEAKNRLTLETTYENLVSQTNLISDGKIKVANILQTINAGLEAGSSSVGVAQGIKNGIDPYLEKAKKQKSEEQSKKVNANNKVEKTSNNSTQKESNKTSKQEKQRKDINHS